MRNLLLPFLLLWACAIPADEVDDAIERGDHKAAIELLEVRATRNDIPAAYRLGVMYRDGAGVKADPALAVKWLTLASETDWMREKDKFGLPEAQYALGCLYRDGVGMAADLAQAAEWFEQAAEQGYEQAQLALGEMYLRGNGVDQDYLEGFIWLSLAAERLSGDEADRAVALRKEARKQLSKDDLEEARQRIADFEP